MIKKKVSMNKGLRAKRVARLAPKVAKNKHVGSDFEDFLRDEGILEEATAVAIKRVIAYQLQKQMEQEHITQEAMAQKLHTSRSALKRLLDPNNFSSTLLTISRAAAVIGKELSLNVDSTVSKR